MNSDNEPHNNEETTLGPMSTLNEEYRSNIPRAAKAEQWFFDEFLGLYRCKALGVPTGSQPALHSDKSSPIQTPLRQRLPLSMSCLSLSTKCPLPESIEDVYTQLEKARNISDLATQLFLCEELVKGTWPLTITSHSERPARSPAFFERRAKVKAPSEHVVRLARRILKRLATTSQGISRTASGQAQYLLANCFGTGALGFPVQIEQAFLWYIQASKQSHQEAIYRAGVCYELGIGTKKDTSRSMQFYRKGANLSHLPSMYKLGMILFHGCCDQAPCPREAVSWLQRAAAVADAENPHAIHAVAMMHLTGDIGGTNLIADPQYGLDQLTMAAKYGYSPSQVILGEIYEQGTIAKADDHRSIYWYTRAAQQANADAALALSRWYLTGSPGVLAQSDREAYLWARKAVSSTTHQSPQTLGRASFLVGLYIENGIGTDADRDKAVKWYQKAASFGHKGAAERYTQLSPPPEPPTSLVVDERSEIACIFCHIVCQFKNILLLIK